MDDAYTVARSATVRLNIGGGSQGVLVPGGIVLTAMHCIAWDRSAGLVLGEHHLVEVETADRQRFHLEPAFADVVSDMAALETAEALYPARLVWVPPGCAAS